MSHTMTIAEIKTDIKRMRAEVGYIRELARVSPTPWKTNRIRTLKTAIETAHSNLRDVKREEVGASNIIGSY